VFVVWCKRGGLTLSSKLNLLIMNFDFVVNHLKLHLIPSPDKTEIVEGRSVESVCEHHGLLLTADSFLVEPRLVLYSRKDFLAGVGEYGGGTSRSKIRNFVRALLKNSP